MDAKFLNYIARDFTTYTILTKNQNYKDRLLEAYNYIKAEGVTSVEDFTTRKGLKVGAFEYDEITIFDRLSDKEYEKLLNDTLSQFEIRKDYLTTPDIGDQLASWGTLGNTPYRESFIRKGLIVEGLTPEEQQRHFG